MKIIPFALAAALLAGCVVSASSGDLTVLKANEATLEQEVVGVNARGGVELIIQHGSEYKFENTGTSEGWKIGYENDTLVIECDRRCRKSGNQSATVTLPVLEDIALTGGGEIVVRGDFPDVSAIDIALTGGGEIDALAVTADEANVALVGGGEIRVSAVDELNASIVGGGEIGYRGSPELSRSVIGGGSVEQIR